MAHKQMAQVCRLSLRLASVENFYGRHCWKSHKVLLFRLVDIVRNRKLLYSVAFELHMVAAVLDVM